MSEISVSVLFGVLDPSWQLLSLPYMLFPQILCRSYPNFFRILLHSWHSRRPSLATWLPVSTLVPLCVFYYALLISPPLTHHQRDAHWSCFPSLDVNCTGAGIFICLVPSSQRASGMHGIKCPKGIMEERSDKLWWNRRRKGGRGINNIKNYSKKVTWRPTL